MKEHEKISFELNPKLLSNKLYIKFSDFDKVMKKILNVEKENEQLKQELKNTFIYNKKVVAGLVADKDYLTQNNADLKQSLDWANERETEWSNRIEELKTDLEYAKAIIKDLLNNSHEYSRQNVEEFIKGEKK